MTPIEALLARGCDRLIRAGVPGAARDARVLLRAVPLTEGAEVSPQQDATYMTAIDRRARREPVSHILGRRAFWKHDFHVTADVLDPRPETETLVAHARDTAGEARQILDLGTGSGCILLSLLHELPAARGLGTDLSPAALSIAQGNAARVGVADRVAWLESDWFDGIRGMFDLIVSNPPYIAQSEMDALAPELRDWEPRLALTPGGDGLDAYRAITARAPAHLHPGGWLMVEIGPTQGAQVQALFAAAGLARVSAIRDLDGRDRVISGEKPRES